MNDGKKFEEDWKNSFKKVNAYYFRIKDSASSFGGGNTSFTRSNPYDCFCLYEGRFVAMELKSTQGTSFSFEKQKTDKGKMIHLNQITGLQDVVKIKDTNAGFIFNFRERETYWLSIQDFMNFYTNTNKMSINEKDVIEYNGLLIQKNKMKVRFRYDIQTMLDTLIKE